MHGKISKKHQCQVFEPLPPCKCCVGFCSYWAKLVLSIAPLLFLCKKSWQPGKWFPARIHEQGKGFWQCCTKHSVTLGKARRVPSAWGRSRVCVWIQERLKFTVRWPMQLFTPRRNPGIAPLSAALNGSHSCSRLWACLLQHRNCTAPSSVSSFSTQRLYSSIFSFLLLTWCTPSLSPAPSSPVCMYLSPKKSPRERDLSSQHCADPLSPPLKLWN